jgi:hypothetical protein
MYIYFIFVWPCILVKWVWIYQLDATLIFILPWGITTLYMFRAFIVHHQEYSLKLHTHAFWFYILLSWLEGRDLIYIIGFFLVLCVPWFRWIFLGFLGFLVHCCCSSVLLRVPFYYMSHWSTWCFVFVFVAYRCTGLGSWVCAFVSYALFTVT